MRYLTIIILLTLAGCGTLNTAGQSSYTVKPFEAKDGTLVCCALDMKDGKEYSGRNIQFQTNGAAFGLTISEGESKAFTGQGIAAKALSVLPVTNLPLIPK